MEESYARRFTGLIDPDQAEFIELYISEHGYPPGFAEKVARAEADMRAKRGDDPPAPRPGKVYVLQVHSYFKIGWTSHSVSARVQQLQVGCPYPLMVRCVIKSEDAPRLELELHQRFENQKQNGEWFQLSDSDLAYIKSMQEQI